jgi:hypothetical protein
MNKAIKIVIALTGLLFLMIGLRWLADPGGAGADLGMVLLDGVGRSSQIGDIASFFLTLGICILSGVATSKRYWFYPAVMLLGIAGFSRLVAWVVHDAALAMDLIGFEVVVACLLWFGSARICNPDNYET